MGGLEDDLDVAVSKPVGARHAVAPIEPVRPPQRVAATAPKFEDRPGPRGPSQSPRPELRIRGQVANLRFARQVGQPAPRIPARMGSCFQGG